MLHIRFNFSLDQIKYYTLKIQIRLFPFFVLFKFNTKKKKKIFIEFERNDNFIKLYAET